MIISAIIVVYNGINWLEKCLNSIKNSKTPIQVFIVDNNSTDGSQAFILKKYPNFKLIQLNQNIGFGKANNIGIERAYKFGADYFFLLNQDVYLKGTTVEILLQSAIDNPEYGIISPMHLNGDGTALDYLFSTYIIPSACKNLYSDIYLNKAGSKIYDAFFINAAAWFVSKKCIETIGGFSPSFFHYAEDYNYCQRMQYHGLKLGVVANTEIYHDRENRPLSIYNADYTLFTEKQIILEYSNPLENKTKRNFYFTYVIKPILSLRINKIKNCIKNFNILLAINFKYLEQNKQASLLKKPSFLDLHSPI